MNDFLATLVARSRGADAVRPRLPSRFEVPAGPAPRTDEAAEVRVTPQGPATRPVRGVDAPSAADFARDVASALDHPPSAPAARSPTPFDRPPPPALPVAPRPLANESPVLPSRSRREPEPGPAQAAFSAPRVERAQETRTPASRAATVAHPARAPVPATPHPVDAAPRQQPEPPRLTPSLPSPAPRRVRSPPAPALPIATRRATLAETTVHVSIGRVDVRLHAEPERVRSHAAGAPAVMSLDDYLRSRAGR